MNDENEKVRVIIRLSGRVQGVAFRYYARNKANQLGISGWIRNLDNGDVEALIEGKRGLVLQMIAWCKKGPSLVRIENISIDWQNYTGEFNQFSIF